MRGERNPDVYLSGDLIVRKMAEKYPVLPQKAAPWQSYLTLQLWQLRTRIRHSASNVDKGMGVSLEWPLMRLLYASPATKMADMRGADAR